MNSYVVIMAGGSGERFWPLSRMRKPKQLLALTSSSMMIEEAIDRISPLIPHERILIITSEVLQQPLIDALPGIPSENVIAEPAKRNTAPCLALACSVIRAREAGNDALMAVLTADHFIGNADAFRADVSRALTFASTYDSLVTIGIPPTRPETGYGYIHVGEPTVVSGVSHVVEFKEKPDLATALDYVRSGRYVWNSGMFFWRTEALRAAMMSVLPEVGNAIDGLTDDLATRNTQHMSEVFHALPDISIDYGVMERSHNVHVVPATFPWDDVGSWDALERMRPLDATRNVVDGVVTVVDTEGSIIVNAYGSAHTVTTVGLRDTVVVVTPDATMVCPKDRAQDVKRIVTELRTKDRHDIL